MEEQKNIPELRFPGFDEGWERDILGEKCNISSGGTPSRSNPNYWKGAIPWVSTALIDFNIIESVDEYISEDGLHMSSAKLFSKGTILMAMYGQGKTRGKVSILGIDASTNQACAAIKPKENTLDTNFLYQNLAGRYDSIRNISNSGGQDNLSAALIKNLQINFPSLPEQQKIASFFTAIDKKISQLKQKKTLLEQYKKGVMQKIFTQEIRFRDENGQEFPKWEKKTLADVANKKSSNISANKIEDNHGDFIIYGASGVLKKVDFYEEENDYISIVKDGAGVGRLLYCNGKSSVLGTMEIIKPRNAINPYFLFCLLSNVDFIKYVTGSTIPHIYFKDYSKENCTVPCIEEQSKIAYFLSAIENKINYTQSQIEKTEHWKKGLLQKMFV